MQFSYRFISASLAALLLTASCNDIPTPTLIEYESEGTLQEALFAVDSAAISFDPRKVSSPEERTVARFLFTPLFGIGEQEELVPLLAESYSYSEDGKELTITLREGLLWSDGSALTASDVIATIKSLYSMQCPTRIKDALASINGSDLAFAKHPDALALTAVSDSIIKIGFSTPQPYFLYQLTEPAFTPLPKQSLGEKMNTSYKRSGAIPTSGPYTIAEQPKHKRLALRRNRNYYKSESYPIDSILLVETRRANAYQAFADESVDWIGAPWQSLTKQSATALRESDSLQQSIATSGYSLLCNTEQPILQNQLMRSALSNSIDREAIATALSETPCIPASTFFPGTEVAERREEIPFLYAPDRARKIAETLLQNLSESKRRIHLLCDSSPKSFEIAKMCAQYWNKALRITVVVETASSAMWAHRVKHGYYQLALAKISSHSNSWKATLAFLLSKKVAMFAEANRERLEELLSPTASDFSAANRFLSQSLPCIPLVYDLYEYAPTRKLKKAVVEPSGELNLKEAFFAEPEEESIQVILED